MSLKSAFIVALVLSACMCLVYADADASDREEEEVLFDDEFPASTPAVQEEVKDKSEDKKKEAPSATPTPTPVPPKVVECAKVPEIPRDRRPWDKKRDLVIASLNTNWLFSKGGGNTPWKSKSKAKIHFDRVKNMMSKINPDVWQLQGVEGCHILQKLIKKLPRNRKYRAYLVAGGEGVGHEQVGFLSRIDPIDAISHSVEGYSYTLEENDCGLAPTDEEKGKIISHASPPHAMLHLSVQKTHVFLLNALLASDPTEPVMCTRREGESKVIAEEILKAAKIVEEYGDKGIIVVSGGINDHDSDKSARDPYGYEPMSRVMETLKSEGKLKNVLSLLKPEDRFTEWSDVIQNDRDDKGPEHLASDHILVSGNAINSTSAGWRVMGVTIDHRKPAAEDHHHWPIVMRLRHYTSHGDSDDVDEAEYVKIEKERRERARRTRIDDDDDDEEEGAGEGGEQSKKERKRRIMMEINKDEHVDLPEEPWTKMQIGLTILGTVASLAVGAGIVLQLMDEYYLDQARKKATQSDKNAWRFAWQRKNKPAKADRVRKEHGEYGETGTGDASQVDGAGGTGSGDG